MRIGDVFLNIRSGEAYILSHDRHGNPHIEPYGEIECEIDGEIAPIDEVLAEIEAACADKKRSGRSYED